MHELGSIDAPTYNSGAQTFTEIDTFSDGTRFVSFWYLDNPVDTAGTDVTVKPNAVWSGGYFAAWSLEDADTSTMTALSDADTTSLSVDFTGLSAGSLVLDAVANNDSTLPTATGPTRGTSYSANDFSASGFLSGTTGLSGNVSIGATADNVESVYGALAVQAIPEPSTIVLLLGSGALALISLRRRKA